MGLTVNNANIYFNTNGATRMTINNSGNVGIGTSSPNCPLQLVTQAIPKQICLYEVANNNFNFVGFGNGGGMKLQINDITNDSIRDYSMIIWT